MSDSKKYDENGIKTIQQNPDKISVQNKRPRAQQSADSFFHFVQKYDYLQEIIVHKKFFPRYCKESLASFNIELTEIMVLMKCFCDIPLHQVNSHRKEYGDFCVGMTKEWGMRSGLQPVIYYNPDSNYPKTIKKSFETAMKYSDENDSRINDFTEILNENLKFQKCVIGEDFKTKKSKDFRDEKEWRFVPRISNDEDLTEIISDLRIINKPNLIETYNAVIKKSKYCLSFEYSDIKYIFVRNKTQRKKMISLINKLNIQSLEKDVLISKICVWNEMEGDF